MNSVAVGAAIIAVVEFIKRFVPQISGDWTILLCAVLGGIAGLLGLGGLDVVSGIMVGLGASGAHQVASAAAGK